MNKTKKVGTFWLSEGEFGGGIKKACNDMVAELVTFCFIT